MRISKYILLFLFIAFCFTDCKKYSGDNRFVHFRTAKSRLIERKWTQYPGKKDIYMIFQKNGTFVGAPMYYDKFFDFTGTWEFFERKNKLRIVNTSANILYEFDIIELEKSKNHPQPYDLILRENPRGNFHSFECSD